MESSLRGAQRRSNPEVGSGLLRFARNDGAECGRRIETHPLRNLRVLCAKTVWMLGLWLGAAAGAPAHQTAPPPGPGAGPPEPSPAAVLPASAAGHRPASNRRAGSAGG